MGAWTLRSQQGRGGTSVWFWSEGNDGVDQVGLRAPVPGRNCVSAPVTGCTARCGKWSLARSIASQLELPGGQILTAIITREALTELGFVPGQRACA